MTFGSETGERVLKEGARLKEGCLFVLNSGIGGTLSRMSGLEGPVNTGSGITRTRKGPMGGRLRMLALGEIDTVSSLDTGRRYRGE